MILFRWQTPWCLSTPRIAQNRTYPTPIVGRTTGATPRPSNRRCAARCPLRPQLLGFAVITRTPSATRLTYPRHPPRPRILHRNLGQSRHPRTQVCARRSRSPGTFPTPESCLASPLIDAPRHAIRYRMRHRSRHRILHGLCVASRTPRRVAKPALTARNLTEKAHFPVPIPAPKIGLSNALSDAFPTEIRHGILRRNTTISEASSASPVGDPPTRNVPNEALSEAFPRQKSCLQTNRNADIPEASVPRRVRCHQPVQQVALPCLGFTVQGACRLPPGLCPMAPAARPLTR